MTVNLYGQAVLYTGAPGQYVKADSLSSLFQPLESKDKYHFIVNSLFYYYLRYGA